MNAFVAKDTCLLCGDIVSIVINRRLKPIVDGPYSLSICDKCKQRLIDDKKLVLIEVIINSKGKIIGLTGRIAEIDERAIKPDALNYDKIIKDRTVFINEETFNYLEKVRDTNGKA